MWKRNRNFIPGLDKKKKKFWEKEKIAIIKMVAEIKNGNM